MKSTCVLPIAIIALLLFLVGIPQGHTEDSGTINDAVFSPDGKWLGVGTSQGLDIYERDTWVLQYHRDFGQGVHYLRWSPDSKRLVVAYEQSEDANLPKTFCAVMDVFSGEELFKIKEPVRWFQYVRYNEYEDRNINVVGEVPGFHGSHPNLLAFSKDGALLAYIDVKNRIRIWSIESKTIIKNIADNEQYFASIGFIDNSRLIWLGTDTNLLFMDIDTEEIVKIIQLKRNGILQVLQPFDVSFDLKYILSAIPRYVVHESEVYDHYLYDQNGEFVKVLYESISYTSTSLPQDRTQFLANGKMVGLKHSSFINFDGLLYVSEQENGDIYYGSDVNFPLLPNLPLQPFSPDGEEFLMFMENEQKEKELYVVKSRTFQSTKVPLAATRVENYPLH